MDGQSDSSEHDELTEQEVELPEGQTFPLNSRRVTHATLRAIAEALELPGKGKKPELLTVIEGKLSETREVRNIQVIVQEREIGATKLFLLDDEGVFLETESGAGRESGRPARIEGAEHEKLRREVEDLTRKLRETEQQVERSTTRADGATAEVESLRSQLKKEKERAKKLWALNCRRATEQENLLVEKDLEIEGLTARLEGHVNSEHDSSSESESDHPQIDLPRSSACTLPRKGRAPPIDQYTGENPEVRFDDWLPSLDRAASWNSWSESERLIQLAGHLRGRALQEWDLMEETDRGTWSKALPVLRERLDQGTKVLAAQDFRHTTQKETEKVADFVRRLERVFHIAYGRESITKDTREAFLYGQLQEGLRIDVLRNPAVSGALTYPELIMAAKNEEQRQSELRKRQHYQVRPGERGFKESVAGGRKFRESGSGDGVSKERRGDKSDPSPQKQGLPEKRVCYNCGKPGHLANKCWSKKTESRGSNHKPAVTTGSSTRQVKTTQPPEEEVSPLTYLFSSDDDSVRMVRVKDEGSHAQMAGVQVQGFSTEGIVDSGADITIVNGELFKKIAAEARLKKRDFKPADKTLHLVMVHGHYCCRREYVDNLEYSPTTQMLSVRTRRRDSMSLKRNQGKQSYQW